MEIVNLFVSALNNHLVSLSALNNHASIFIFIFLQEMAYLYIPNSAVGAIIGTKGSHIRNIIRFSGASVKIAPLEDDGRPTEQTERKVTIVGTPEAQWKVRILEAILELLSIC